MKTLLIALALAGIVPDSGHAQTLAPGRLSFGLRAGRASLRDGMLAAAPKSRARTLDLRAGNGATLLINGYSGYPPPGLDISNNWFGSNSPSVSNFNYTVITSLLTSAPGASGLSCGSLFTLAGHKNVSPQSMLDGNDTTCNHTLGMGYSLVTDGLYDQAYDSVCYYLSHCYAVADPNEAFGALSMAGADTVRSPTGRTSLKGFLLSVLPLRSDDAWFCACVVSFEGTFFEDANYDRKYLSLLKWLIDNPRCTAKRSAYAAAYDQARQDDYHSWQDTMHHPEVYDSTLLTMDQMGLDTVLKIAASDGVHYEALGSQIILDARVTTNPFPNATSVSLSIGREAYVYIDVFDLLGHKVTGSGGVFEQGTRDVPLAMDAAPPGIYYVRITTANNEVRTLKITKE